MAPGTRQICRLPGKWAHQIKCRGAGNYGAGDALNLGVSKIEIPGKSQMALTTDKWLWLAGTVKIVHRQYSPIMRKLYTTEISALFAPYRRFMHPLIKSTINSYTARIWTARSVKRHTAN